VNSDIEVLIHGRQELQFYRAMLRRARLWNWMSSVRLSVCLSVTFKNRDHIGWNSTKIRLYRKAVMWQRNRAMPL